MIVPDPKAPRAGALVWVDFEPVRGSEQAGARPALVVSATRFNQVSRRSLVCPVTSNLTPWPTKVALPEGLPVTGAVLADQIRSLDRTERGFRPICQAPPQVLADVRSILASLMEEEPA